MDEDGWRMGEEEERIPLARLLHSSISQRRHLIVTRKLPSRGVTLHPLSSSGKHSERGDMGVLLSWEIIRCALPPSLDTHVSSDSREECPRQQLLQIT